MKKILFILAVLMVSSKVYGQLPYPEMKLTSSNGESHAFADDYAQVGTFVPPDGTTDYDFADAVLLPMHDSDVNKVFYDLNVVAGKTIGGPAAYSDTYANLNFSCTQIGTSFTTDPNIVLFSEHYQNSGVATVVGTTLNHAAGKAITAGKYTMVVSPNNPGTWGTSQKVPARLIVDLMPIETTPGGGISWSRNLVYHVEVKWGASHIKATWDNDNSSWYVETKTRENPNDVEHITNIWYTDYEEDGMNLNLDIKSFEEVTAYGSVVGQVIISNSPTTQSFLLPSANELHRTKQTVDNFLGTGSGSGNVAAYFSGQAKLVPEIKLKKQ